MTPNELVDNRDIVAADAPPSGMEGTAPAGPKSRKAWIKQRWGEQDKRLNLLMGALMLVLAFAFMLPGLPPFRVAAPMEYLLPFAPWHRYFPDVTSPFTGGDLLTQQLPWHQWAQDEFAAGRFPLWASSPFGGMPLFAGMQPGVLFPLHLLWMLMPIGAGLGVIMALKMWLAGVGMWVFLRAFKLHPMAACIGALSFMFSTSMVNWLTWGNSNLILLLPWLAWAVYAWWVEGSRGALVALAVLVGLAILAGHPETLFLASITMAIWTLGLLLADRNTGRVRLSRLAGLAMAMAVGFLIGMIQLLPFLEIVPLTHQVAVRQSLGQVNTHFYLPAKYLLDWLVPRSDGYMPDAVLGTTFLFTESNGYVGLVPIIGLLFTVVAALQRRLRLGLVLPWIAVVLFAGFITYDDTVGSIIRSLPFFNQSINVRWVIVVGFALIVMGAFGWDWLARTAASASVSGRYKVILGGSLVLVAVGAVLMAANALGLLPKPVLEKAGPWLHVNGDYALYWSVWFMGIGLMALGLAGVWATSSRGRRIAPAAIALLLIVDLWTLLMPINGTAPADQYYPSTSFQQQVKAVMPATERVLVEGEVMPANTGLIYKIRDWRASDAMTSERAYQALLTLDIDIKTSVPDEYTGVLRHTSREVGPLFGMQYYIFEAGINPNYPVEEGAPPFTRLVNKDGLSLWRAEGVPGFAYLSDNVQTVSNEKGALAWMNDSSWEKTRSYAAVVEAQPEQIASIKRDPAGSSPGRADVEQYTPGHIRIGTDARRPALLVVAESWYPGWSALLDGKPTPILRTNYLSQGIQVPEGKHIVEMDYRPASMTYGSLASGAGLLGLAAMAVWAKRRDA